MTGTPAPVVVGVDGSSSALEAVAWAARECARHRIPLRLVHALLVPVRGYPELLITEYEVRQAMEDQAKTWLTAAEAVAREARPDVDVEAVTAIGAAVPVLIGESKGARMVVLGSQGLGGFTGLLIGSTAVGLSAHGHCPVVVVRGTPADDAPVVVGVDGSPASEAAIEFAFAAASTRGVPLTAVMTWTDFLVDSPYNEARLAIDWEKVDEAEQRLLAERMAGWQEKYPDVHVDRVVLRDRPVRALLKLAESAQLLVVGSRGHGGFTGMLLGSTSQALVYHAPCPLAVVRPTS
ncbi:universal stress protein [Umezawaea endophytica]|uniref:Universal stress protein n=1 Tax=Umezawaea endophytica TaxID=1654476 RepID=A0A9X3AJL3_9PSEU|nr:universal stress protein [Umezawaea endophytica]MCS7484742.1 universal stress protein [Umezawaea endophytica]